MAIYKIFPEKDTTVYSFYPVKNTGRDEILEISNNQNSLTSSTYGEVSRVLIKFSTSDILNVLNNKVGNSQFSASLKLYNAFSTAIPLDYTLYCYPLSQSWNMGTGKFGDNPQTINGVSWLYTLNSGSGRWTTSSFGNYVTASFLSNNKGGGTWYTGSSTLNPVSSQSFSYNDINDIEFDVTNTVKLWNSGSIQNEGFIVKLQDSLEFQTGSYFGLSNFSMDTHTIYPPSLEIKWNDYSFNTGSSTFTFINSNKIVITISNNVNKYYLDNIQRFRINVRPQFPSRAFQTSSVYLKNYYLPTSSYYSVKDLDTDETIIDFDNIFTKISADENGNYFDIYMDGLEPERYYKILIKTTISGSTNIFDDNYYFKIIQ
jgi:hypothetical protein